MGSLSLSYKKKTKQKNIDSHVGFLGATVFYTTNTAQVENLKLKAEARLKLD